MVPGGGVVPIGGVVVVMGPVVPMGPVVVPMPFRNMSHKNSGFFTRLTKFYTFTYKL